MRQTKYHVGEVVELEATATNTKSGDAVDPGDVVCTVLKPDGTTAKPAVDHPATGVYIAEIKATEAGTWRYAFDGLGSNEAAGEKSFEVVKKRVPR